MFGRTYLLSTVLVFCGSCSLLVDAVEKDEATAVDASTEATDADTTGATADAMPVGDASSTTEACTEVQADGSCIITCDTPACAGPIVCPEGRDCTVNCIGTKACEVTSIDCTQARNCTINCEGGDACKAGGVQCAGENCEIRCVGNSTCKDAPTTCTAQTCNVFCDGDNACSAGVCCQGATCDETSCTAVNGGDCTCNL